MTEYIAPDAENEGSIAFGAASFLGLSGHLYVIAAGAPVPANLSELSGAPTCLELTLESDVITSMHYATSGSVRGPVVVYGDPENDPENSLYLTAGRVMTPAFALADPGLRAVLGNAAVTGKDVAIVLNIHPDFGVPLSFVASTSLRGQVVTSATDINVGAGTLPEAVVDSTSRSLLEQAAGDGVSAKVVVTSEGTIDVNSGALNVTTELVVTLASDPVSGTIGGPCRGPAYYGVFDNSAGSQTTRFRFKWTTNHGSHVVTKAVPAGAIYRTWTRWAKRNTVVSVSYRQADSGPWVNLASRVAVHGYFPSCDYQPGFQLPPG